MRTAARETHGIAALHSRTNVNGVIELFFIAYKLVVPDLGLGCIYVVTGLQDMFAKVVEASFAFNAWRLAVVYFVIEVIVSHHLAVGGLHLQGHTKAADIAAKGKVGCL